MSKKGRFSTYKNLDDVLNKFNIVGELSSLPGFRPETIEIKKDDPHFEHCLENLKEKLSAFGERYGKNEARAREFISPILIAAVLLAPGTRLDVETSVTGEDDLGHVDYSILKGNELVCISEAKKSEMGEGIAMNLMQCKGALQQNKQKRKRADGFDYIYGVITNACQWRYIILTSEGKVYWTKYEDMLPLSGLALEDDGDLRRAVKKTVGTIAWMLQDRTQVDEPIAKKQRVSAITDGKLKQATLN